MNDQLPQGSLVKLQMGQLDDLSPDTRLSQDIHAFLASNPIGDVVTDQIKTVEPQFLYKFRQVRKGILPHTYIL